MRDACGSGLRGARESELCEVSGSVCWACGLGLYACVSGLRGMCGSGSGHA